MKFTIKNLFVLALSMISLNTYAQATGQIRTEFIKGFVSSCVENQKTLPENKGVTLKVIDSYCKCMAQTSANSLTNQQIEMLDKLSTQDVQQNAFLQNVIKKSTEYCQVNYDKFAQSQAQEQINFPACNGDFSGPCFGVREYPNGDKYVGQFLNGNCSGQGTLTFADGRVYVGQWRDDKRNGQATLTWPDGAKYVGQFADGLRNGQGTLTLPDGRQYVGQWRDAKFNGQGTYTWPDGMKYVGQWRDDQRNGQGTQSWPDGRQYVGQFKDGQYSGQGTYRWPDGRQYLGQWTSGKRNGQGTLSWPDGEKYVGQYIDDLRNGQGSLTFPDGRQYVGQWRDGKYDGQGIFYNSNGSIRQQGVWRNGEFVQTQTPPPPPPKIAPVAPKPPVNNAQDIKRQKCINLGLAPGSIDFQQCIN